MEQKVKFYQSRSNLKKYYEIGSIGKGSQGQVKMVLDDHSNVYALKVQYYVRKYEKAFLNQIIQINEENRLKLIQESTQDLLKAQSKNKLLDPIQFQCNINQNKLLQIYEHFQIDDSPIESFCVVSEFFYGGNLETELKDKIKNYNLIETANIIIDICEQLEIIHSMNYIVLDLKPANIVVQKSNQNQRYKICDFGSILYCNENQQNPSMTQSRWPTPYYQAPEVFEDDIITKKVDIWALGIIMFELLTRKKLFDGSHFEIKKKIINYQKNENHQQQKTSQDIQENIKEGKIRELLHQMIAAQPEQRCDLKTIQEVLKPYKTNKLADQYEVADSQTQENTRMLLKNLENDLKLKIGQNEQLLYQLKAKEQQIIAYQQRIQQLEQQEKVYCYKITQLEDQTKQYCQKIAQLEEELKRLMPQKNLFVQRSCTLILGKAGAGKTEFLKKLFGQEIGLFQPKLYGKLNSDFIDTEPFDFEDIHYRDEQIEKYQYLFKSLKNQINNIMIFINFDRIDLMKRQLMRILTHFNKFKEIITLVVTDFQQSKNKEEDKQNLKMNFEQFKVRDIKFIERNFKEEEINHQIQDLYAKAKVYQLDLKGTLFEEANPAEQEKFIQQFKQTGFRY